jgi:hypothetical protein
VNKSAHDETSCPLTKKNAKGHFPGVVAIVGMSLMLLSDDRGRLAHDETPYPLWENFITLLIFNKIKKLFFLGSIKGGASTT